MTDKNPVNEPKIQGICCDAVNCVYNQDTHECHADTITVANPNAHDAEETSCATFKDCDDCNC